MSEIAPGVWVEVLDLGGPCAEMPTGSVWLVEEVYPEDAGVGCDVNPSCPLPSIKLVGNPDDDWCACGFRPIYRPKADLIERLMAPAPVAPVKITEAA